MGHVLGAEKRNFLIRDIDDATIHKWHYYYLYNDMMLLPTLLLEGYY